MLSLHADPAALCDGLSRREWLRVGGLGAFGLTLPRLLQARAANPPAKPKACIQLFLLGGPPQHETWDPKPDAPPEIRGDLGVIRTATPGLIVGEYMPQTAKRTGRIAVLRAVQTGDPAHSSSGYYMTTGRPHAPAGVENAKPGAPNDWPSLGGLVRRLLPGRGSLPAAITLPEQAANDGNLTWPGQDAGFLGRTFDPWLLTGDPSAAGFQVPGLGLPDDVPPARFDGRRTLRDAVDAHFAKLDRTGPPAAYDGHTRRAYDLIASAAARKAFDLGAEPAAVRDRYGRHRFGQACLLARRLVEAGVPLVRVNWTRVPDAPNNGHWDTHTQNGPAVKKLLPLLDASYTALLDDLTDRGLLDSTLVVWTGEFGRTPRLNPAGGRDHWGNVFSVALAGGGVRGGAVVGASDKQAAFPKDGRVRPEDLTATILDTLGVSPDAEIHDTLGRPFPASRGRVLRELF
ncbi:MAG: DUF1501 domain-containing protein [Gemmataceae bacterium]